MRLRVFLLCCWLLGGVWLTPAAAEEGAPWQPEREYYREARDAAARGDWPEFKRLRRGLGDYPLAIYLDYLELSAHVRQLTPEEVSSFLEHSRGSALPNRLLSVYLAEAGRRGRWRDFLAVMPREPNSIDLKCYYFRALLAEGDSQLAYEGARRLWIHGESRPKACDPLFAAWMRAGELDDDTVWSRLLAVFDARQRGLMNYVVSKASADLRQDAERLRAVYVQPNRLRSLVPARDDARTRDIVARGVAFLARYREREALQHWQAYQREMAFTPEQVLLAEKGIALRSLFARSEANREWVDRALGRLGDDSIVELRLRWAIDEQDWSAVAVVLDSLSPSAREQPVWRYWEYRVLMAKGRDIEARAILESLVNERDYYGFLAARLLDVTPRFAHRRLAIAPLLTEELQQGLARVSELRFHGDIMLAHSEWAALLRGRAPEVQLSLGSAAAQRDWHRMAIDAVSRAEAWDYLDLRFPLPWRDTFDSYGRLRRVPGTELMAIARRESAFFPKARSPVGARGLMQVMPATGGQVARRLGVRHSVGALYDVDHNVMLASAYYRELLDKYQGNRVFAMAAYNAGPARVARWRNAEGEGVPVDVWVESIPFRETRNYVKNVLAYNLIFQYLQGDTGRLFSDQEWRQAY